MARTISKRRSQDGPRRCASRTVALRRCFVALGFIAVLVALCITAASEAASLAVAAIIATCCAIPVGALVILELVPALSGVREDRASAVQRRAMRSLRRELDALPETSHPLDA